VRRRQLTLEQARTIVPNNVITRSLGPEAEVQVDVGGPYPVRPGDVFVLCSDGLSNQLDDAEIGALARSLPAQEACQDLVDIANLRGGPDNITLVVVRLGDPKDSPSAKSAKPSRFAEVLQHHSALCLVVGTLSILSSLPLWIRGLQGFGKFAWALGLLLVAAGLIWQYIASRRVKKPPPPEPVAYRHVACTLDKPLLDRFHAQVEHVHAVATEQGWSFDGAEFALHRDAMEQATHSGDGATALREAGQCLHVLAVAQRAGQEQARQLLEGS
jgi:protein phosphatase